MKLEIPVRIRVWKRYRYRIVLIPPRGDIRQTLSRLNSGDEYYGVLRHWYYGEARSFKVGVKFYTWSWEKGLNTVFVITDSDCEFCVEVLKNLINQYGTVNGVLTLYLP